MPTGGAGAANVYGTMTRLWLTPVFYYVMFGTVAAIFVPELAFFWCVMLVLVLLVLLLSWHCVRHVQLFHQLLTLLTITCDPLLVSIDQVAPLLQLVPLPHHPGEEPTYDN